MVFGTGKYRYTVAENWDKTPDGWKWGWIPAVATDSQDRVFVYSRSENPLAVFDRDGNFLETWGNGVLPPEAAHGIYIDAEDNVYCTDNDNHCVFKFNRNGELTMTLGTPGEAAPADGDPFNSPTDLAIASTGELFISDGYGNARSPQIFARWRIAAVMGRAWYWTWTIHFVTRCPHRQRRPCLDLRPFKQPAPDLRY